MQRSTIALVWLGGLVLAALIYLTGPYHVLAAVWNGVDQLQYLVANVVAALFGQAFEAVRALALALFAVFLVLGFLASQKGVRPGGLLGITVLFVGLIAIGGYHSRLCWLAALLVALAGALHMTQRLLLPSARTPWDAAAQRRRV